jgi:hypothetical protein
VHVEGDLFPRAVFSQGVELAVCAQVLLLVGRKAGKVKIELSNFVIRRFVLVEQINSLAVLVDDIMAGELPRQMRPMCLGGSAVDATMMGTHDSPVAPAELQVASTRLPTNR